MMKQVAIGKSLAFFQIVCNGHVINCNGDIECGGSIECGSDIDRNGYGFCDGYVDRDVEVVWDGYNDHDGGHRYSSPQTATDFVWLIRDWKNLCVIAMVTQDDLIDLWGDCGFTMDDYVEWLLQDRDTEPPLQTDRRARSTDLQQSVRDWQNIYVMDPQNDFIDLSGDFTMDNYCGVASADGDAKPFQTVEPIAAEIKRRLLSPLFLREYQQNRPMTTKKIRNTKPARGLERFYPFHSMHYQKSESAPTKWIGILEGRVEDPPPRHYEVLTADFRRVLKRTKGEKSQNGVF